MELYWSYRIRNVTWNMTHQTPANTRKLITAGFDGHLLQVSTAVNDDLLTPAQNKQPHKSSSYSTTPLHWLPDRSLSPCAPVGTFWMGEELGVNRSLTLMRRRFPLTHRLNKQWLSVRNSHTRPLSPIDRRSGEDNYCWWGRDERILGNHSGASIH